MKTHPEIRRADPETDFEAILLGARDFVSYARRPDILPDPASPDLEVAVRRLLHAPGVTVLIGEVDGVVMGGIGFFIHPQLWNQSALAFEEIFFWSYPEAPHGLAWKLLIHAKATGTSSGCKIFTFHALANSPKGVDRAYRKLGVEPVQTTYMGAA